MKQYKIEITDLAEIDLERAGDYIAYELKNPTAAVNTVRGIRKQINLLTDFPEKNELDEDELLAELGVRQDYYKNYKIYVTVQSQPRKLSFSRCGVSAKYIFTVKCSRMQAFITFNRKNMLGSEQLQIYYVIEEDTIYIVRILHMLVDSKAWLYRTFGLKK